VHSQSPTTKDRPGLSSERAPHSERTTNFRPKLLKRKQYLVKRPQNGLDTKTYWLTGWLSAVKWLCLWKSLTYHGVRTQCRTDVLSLWSWKRNILLYTSITRQPRGFSSCKAPRLVNTAIDNSSALWETVCCGNYGHLLISVKRYIQE
jgi:hypothetical protein